MCLILNQRVHNELEKLLNKSFNWLNEDDVLLRDSINQLHKTDAEELLSLYNAFYLRIKEYKIKNEEKKEKEENEDDEEEELYQG